jgi:hypothetical protein
MKNGKSLAEAKEEYKINGFCLVCQKGFMYPYGRHYKEGKAHEGTCSLVCEALFQKEKLCNALNAAELFNRKKATSPSP